MQSVLEIFIILTLFLSFVSCQFPNNLAVYNPNLHSECINGTFFIVPVDIATVETVVKPYNLLPVPVTDETLFPNGFPDGKHPVLVTIDYGNDIRMSILQLPNALLQGSITVPYVDRLGDGKSPFTFSVRNYIGGTNGNQLSALVPAAVGTLEGTTIFAATFDPDNAPYKQIASSPAEYTAQIKNVIIPNPVSGPGVILEAVDTDFFTTDSSIYTNHLFHEVISQPLIQNNGLTCQRNPVYFNDSFTDPVFRTGTITLYNPTGAFQGKYTGVAGYSASGVQLGYNSQSCSDAFKNTDPDALA